MTRPRASELKVEKQDITTMSRRFLKLDDIIRTFRLPLTVKLADKSLVKSDVKSCKNVSRLRINIRTHKRTLGMI